jgi:hypothetical protein
MVLALVDSQGFLSGDKTGDYGLSMLLAAHSSSECVNELDKVYALLGILPEEAPVGSLEIDYFITTAKLFLRTVVKLNLFPRK